MLYLGSYLRQFLRDLRTQKLRLALTVFGLVWGTAAVTLLLAFGEGLHRQIIVSQKGLGDNIVICWPTRTSRAWNGLPRGRPVRVTDDDLEVVRRETPEITRISGEYNRDNVKLRLGDKTVVPTFVGANPEFGEMRNVIPAAGGRFLNPTDMEERRRVVFLGDQLKKDLFGEQEAVGRYVRADGVPFQVVGVMITKSQDSNYNGQDKDRATIPLTTYKAMFGDDYVENFVFQVGDTSQVEAAKKKVIATLAHKYRFDPEDEEAVAMWDTTEGVKFLDTFFLAFRAFLGIVGALTLVVGGIGVSNIMNVVVEERTKEIGVKMALGARKRYVLGQFLFETLTLTVLGGSLGFLISWGLCAVFPMFQLKEYVGDPVISARVAAITTAILGTIGLSAGWFPARAAANLNPVEALRM